MSINPVSPRRELWRCTPSRDAYSISMEALIAPSWYCEFPSCARAVLAHSGSYTPASISSFLRALFPSSTQRSIFRRVYTTMRRAQKHDICSRDRLHDARQKARANLEQLCMADREEAVVTCEGSRKRRMQQAELRLSAKGLARCIPLNPSPQVSSPHSPAQRPLALPTPLPPSPLPSDVLELRAVSEEVRTIL